MISNKKIACVIPARLKSTRFPKKMLSILQGKPLLQWVWERAKKVSFFDSVTIAVDAEETRALVMSFGGKCIMTSEECSSGTERLVELLEKKNVDADIWVNWQGDEPFIEEEMIKTLLQDCDKEKSDIWTLKKRIIKKDEVNNPHIAKVVCDARGFALYFSRSPIPFYRDGAPFSQQEVYKHVGLYAYTRAALTKISSLRSCPLEVAEQLEQLRFLYNGLKIRVHETECEVFGIDLPEHLVKAEAYKI